MDETDMDDQFGSYNVSAVTQGLNFLECQSILTAVHAMNSTLEMDPDKINFCRSMWEDRPFVMPWWAQLIWSVAFGSVVAVATVGNLIVIWIIVAHSRMRSTTNYFLLNLSIADLMMAIFNIIFNFVFMLESHWPFGTFYCSVTNFIANLSVATSVFTISAMSVDRYLVIVFPLRPRISRRMVLGIIGVIWICAAALSFPPMIYSTTMNLKYFQGGERVVCLVEWPDGRTSTSQSDYVYNIIFLFSTYIVPVLFMTVTYIWIGLVLWGSKGIGEMSVHQKEVVKAKKRVVRMLIVVVVLFALCWLPYHTYFLYTYHHPDFMYSTYVQHVYLAFYWLAMSNSMYNPLVYYWMNNRFRGYFRSVLCWWRLRTDSQETRQQTWSSNEGGVRTLTFSLRRSQRGSSTTRKLNGHSIKYGKAKNGCQV